MKKIQILEKKSLETGFSVEVVTDAHRYTVDLPFPCSEKEEAMLEWYFEEFIMNPFLETVKFERSQDLIFVYGQRLFDHLFPDSVTVQALWDEIEQNAGSLQLEIVGSEAFHQLHWEAMFDVKRKKPLGGEVNIVRRNHHPGLLLASPQESSVLRLLIVSARPHGKRDVGYRTISRPLVEALEAAQLRVEIEILRPSSYNGLVRILEDRKESQGGFPFHIVHFDLHGAVLSYEELIEEREAVFGEEKKSFGNPYTAIKTTYFEGKRPFVFFEPDEGQQNFAVDAERLADLLKQNNIPIAIFNACQSAKQGGIAEASLASHLMQAGVHLVLAMGYSVTVSAAKKMMPILYRELFATGKLTQGIIGARKELFENKKRQAYFKQQVELEDWILPVVYLSQEVQLNLRKPTSAEDHEWESVAVHENPVVHPYGFFGRDLDIMEIERRLERSNILLVRGMGGVGKTSLFHHLGGWWQKTRWADLVFYFEYESQVYNLTQILYEIGKNLFPDKSDFQQFEAAKQGEQTQVIVEQLNSSNHFLIMDNLETIGDTGHELGSQLSQKELDQLQDFLQRLRGGRCKVILGSRNPERWLAKGTFEDQVYDLPGLDPEATSLLGREILTRYQAEHYLGTPELGDLLELLGGVPLAMEIVLPNLKDRSPAEVLQGLRQGEDWVDADGVSKTESLAGCIDYSLSCLDEEQLRIVYCLSPFRHHITKTMLGKYMIHIAEKGENDAWMEVIQLLQDWGLLGETLTTEILWIHPVLSFYLGNRLAREQNKQHFGTHYQLYFDFCKLSLLIPDRKQEFEDQGIESGSLSMVFRYVFRMEIFNMVSTIEYALKNGKNFWPISLCISNAFGEHRDSERIRSIMENILFTLLNLESVEEQFPMELMITYAILSDCYKELGDLAKARKFVEKSGQISQKIDLIPQGAMEALSQHTKVGLGELDLLMDAPSQEMIDLHLSPQKPNPVDWESLNEKGRAKYLVEEGQWKEGQGDLKRARACFEQARGIFSQRGDDENVARMHEYFARLEVAQGYFSAAQFNYSVAVDFHREVTHNMSDLLKIYCALGKLKMREKDYKKAKEYLQMGMGIAIEHEGEVQQARVYACLGELATETYNLDQAQSYFEKCRDIYRKRNLQTMLRNMDLFLGRIEYLRENYDKAEKLFFSSLNIMENFPVKGLKGTIYSYLGKVKLKQGDALKAKTFFKEALKDEGKSHWDDVWMPIMEGLGEAHFALGELSEASSCLHLMLKSDKGEGHLDLVKVYANLGRIERRRKQLEIAVEYYRMSFETSESQGNESGMGEALFRIGQIEEEKGNPYAALDFYHGALEYAVGDWVGGAHYQIGNLYVQRRDYSSAKAHFLQSADTLKGTSNSDLLPSVYLELGNLSHAENEIEGAKEYFKETAKWAEQFADLNRKGGAFNNLGWILFKENRLDEAEPYFHEAIKAFLLGGSNVAIGRAYYNLGSIYEAKEDLGQMQEYWEKSAKFYKKGGDFSNSGSVLRDLSDIEARNGNPDQALKLISEAADDYLEINDSDGYRECLYHLGRIESSQKNWIKALDYLEQALQFQGGEMAPDTKEKVLYRMGFVHQRLGQLEEAEKYYQESLGMDLNEEQFQMSSLHQLGQVYQKLENYEASLTYRLKALQKGYPDGGNNRNILLRGLKHLYNEWNAPKVIQETARITGLTEEEILEQFS